ncbi:MAG: hypothetical protein K9J25_04050 [Bacteroidales bacterium]|nr:hypothetical protein [Bacteroidales bacterium]
MNYKEHSDNLINILQNNFSKNDFTGKIRTKIPANRYLVKGDLSGIQDFIFSIPSKGAARKLKARSQFITNKTLSLAKRLKIMYPNHIELYIGGGNFYIFAEIQDITDLELFVNDLNHDNSEPYLIISWIEVTDDDLVNFEKTRETLEAICGKAKFQKFKNNPNRFLPYEETKSANPTGNENLKGLPLWNANLIELFSTNSQQSSALNEGEIIQFEHLAALAGIRTGTTKLGVLKLDVDDLGILFGSLPNLDASKAVSHALEYFFDQYLIELLARSYNSKEGTGLRTYYRDNLYIVFSGGDDAFIVGAWDAITDFSLLIAEEFKKYTGFDNMANEDHKLTFSASLMVVDHHFPVKMFSHEAEEMLHKAKYYVPGEKGRINFMGNIFTWEQFINIKELTGTFCELIVNRNESRSFLAKLQQLSLDYEEDSRKSAEMDSIPKVWRLNYVFRDIKKTNKDFIIQKIIRPYEMEMLKFNLEKTNVQANIYYAATRWTELLTRNSK